MNQKMKLISYFTDSHEVMYLNHFLPSLKDGDNWDLLVKKGHQHSIDGNYFSSGFCESTKDKMSFLYECMCGMEEGEYALFSDVDIIHLGEIREYLKGYKDYDISFQKGGHDLNTGFFQIKNNHKTRDLIKSTVENCHLYHDDQDTLNVLIPMFYINYTMFDDRILSPSYFMYPKLWDGHKLPIPRDTLVFHANWCAGIDNKVRLLNYVKNY